MSEWIEFQAAEGVMLRVYAGVTGIRAIEINPRRPAVGSSNQDNPLLTAAAAQLQEYFAGRRRRFDLPLDPQGTEFQRRVWKALEAIPYGQTRNYRQVAESVGAPRAVRAVGAANGRNPLPIVVPCHRVIGADGKLVGYAGGLPVKRVLLDIEKNGATTREATAGVEMAVGT
jgi:methylated-DNA-[protein]-cysteine S-methyltransferase